MLEIARNSFFPEYFKIICLLMRERKKKSSIMCRYFHQGRYIKTNIRVNVETSNISRVAKNNNSIYLSISNSCRKKKSQSES